MCAFQGMCLDKGYDYDEVRTTLKEFGFTAHIRSRGDEVKELAREAGFKIGQYPQVAGHRSQRSGGEPWESTRAEACLGAPNRSVTRAMRLRP